MNKHAYLIIAHHEFELLEMIIKLLDFEQNDIYIHIDKKVGDFDFDRFLSIPKKSGVFFTDRISNTWGAFSGIETELCLLKAAAGKNYSYFHLISGVDLPLKTAKEIYAFFEQNSGKEFVHFCTEEFTKRPSTAERASLYHLFGQKAGRGNNLYGFIDKISLALQRRLKVDRLKKEGIVPYCGANWFSITGDFANYLLSKEDFIKKAFSKSFCADEVFLQTVLMNSKFKDRLSSPCYSDECTANMRYVDWKRGNPYTFRTEDFDILMNSGCLFARKFDLEVDREICDKIFAALTSRQ